MAVRSYRADGAGGNDSVYVLPFTANDIVYNPADGKIYMSVPGSSGANGNSIQTLDPSSGQLGQPVFAGSEPNKLALSDTGHALYVSLDGAFSVKRFITSTMESDLQFATGYDSSHGGRYSVHDLAVPPGFFNIVAVARYIPFFSAGKGVMIFNNSVQAPQSTSTQEEIKSLAFSSTADTLYGSGSSGLKKMLVNINGATVTQSFPIAYGVDIEFSQGKIFTSTGQVINPDNGSVLGTLPSTGSSAFLPDSNGRAYYVVRDQFPATSFTLRAYDINTFTLIGTMTINGVTGDPTKLVRWGANGLALKTSGGQIAVIQTSLIPTAQPVPTPSVTPTPTPTPVPVGHSIDEVNVSANGLAYHASSGKLYASIPSSNGPNGNSVGVIDPAAATLESTAFIGSEPERMKLNSDASKLYVHLSGARQLRVFDIVSGTPGLQFPGGFDVSSDGPLIISDFDTSRVSPDLAAVSRRSAVSFPGNRGTGVFDNGTMRPATRGENDSVVFSDTDSTVYGSAGSALERLTVTAGGVTASQRITFDAGVRIKYGGGRIYGSKGQVIDLATQLIPGTFPIGNVGGDSPRFVLVPEHNRALFLVEGPRRLMAFDLTTFRQLGTIPVPAGAIITDFERAGVERGGDQPARVAGPDNQVRPGKSRRAGRHAEPDPDAHSDADPDARFAVCPPRRSVGERYCV